jgi:NADH-quinone oxidoreductase subunit N
VKSLALAPEIVILATSLLVLLLGIGLSKEKRSSLLVVSAIGVLVALALEVSLSGVSDSLYQGIYLIDPLAVFLKSLFLITTFLVVLASYNWIKDPDYLGEYFALILMATLGMMVVSSCGELILMYVGLGLISLPLYALVTRSNKEYKSKEAGIKYILLGMVSAAVLLYGLTILYGLTGTLVIKDIYRFLIGPIAHPALLVSIAFIMVGFGFKIGMAPVHMWVPDTYEGAPTPVTSFLSVASKMAGFALFLRVFVQALAGTKLYWAPLLEILAILTMFIGNLAALSQTNIKRLLAYSSIAHGGYALLGIVALSKMGVSGVLFYFAGYAFTNLCAFTAVIAFSNATGSDQIEDYAGLQKRAPGVAFAFAIALLSLAGIPLFAGFVGKFYIFASAVFEQYYGLVVLALVNSAISLYYYLKVIRVMYVEKPKTDDPIPVHPLLKTLLSIEAVMVLVIGIYPWIFIKLTDAIAQSFLAGF